MFPFEFRQIRNRVQHNEVFIILAKFLNCLFKKSAMMILAQSLLTL